MMKKIIYSSLLLILLSSLSFSQVAGTSSLNFLSGKWAISGEGGFTYTRSDFKTSSTDVYTRIMGEYFIPTTSPRIFGIRAYGSFGYLGGKGGVVGYVDPVTRLPINEFKTTVMHLGGGMLLAWVISNSAFPYVYTGASYLYFDPRNKSGSRLPNNSVKKYSRHEYSIQGELGTRFITGKNTSLNFSGSLNYVSIDKLDDFRASRDNDIYFSFMVGFSYYWGGKNDADQDGVVDEEDACPETPEGVRVDQFGCPLDSDRDGVPDYLDGCPGTRSNIVVDEDGCPQDSDEDGIADYQDQCLNTPPNIPVDSHGCPLDTDGDGVPDYKDNCLKTPEGVEVDKFGCPLESQEKKLPEITQMILSGDVNFEMGKSSLLPYARTMLDKLIIVLKKYPETRWSLVGYTDNLGSYQSNKRLSLERAWSVADYLISNGIESSRLEVSGMGSDFPLVSNSTSSGRALNRRVEIEMIVGETKESKYSTTTYTGEYNASIERNVGNMIFTDGKQYCIQLSSWRSYEVALREVDRLLAKGENAFITEVSNKGGLVGTWYRVRVGFFKFLQEARDTRARLVK